MVEEITGKKLEQIGEITNDLSEQQKEEEVDEEEDAIEKRLAALQT